MMPLVMAHDHPDIQAAVGSVLESGGTLIFPTETVYGIGGNPWDTRALARVRALKQRSEQQPFTLHLSSVSAVPEYAVVTPRLADRIQRILPGPLTLLLPASSAAPAAAVLDGVVGIRVPRHPLFGVGLRQPVFGTSVNRHGEPPMNDIDQIIDAFHTVDLIVTGLVSGTPSAIVDLTVEPYCVLRGALPSDAERVLDEE